ncbi:MAG: Gfo/Idh/MocA family oxidoreductase [Gemmatimonadota bacterium]
MTSERSDAVQLAIVGTGAISQVVHVPIFVERKDVDVVALADKDPHKARTLADRFGVPRVLDWEVIVDDPDIDAIVITTPNHLHEEMCVRALEAGKHVLVERPIASTAKGAAHIIDVAERTGRILMLGMPHRYRPEVSALRSFVAGGELGRLYSVRGSWMTRPVAVTRPTWRQQRDQAGGGALIDLGIPALDLCLWICGFPKIRWVSCLVNYGDFEVENAATLLAETEDGIALTVEVSNQLYSSDDRFHARVLGTEGSGVLPPLRVFRQLGGRPLEVTPRQPVPRGGENPYTNAYRRLLDEFVRAVQGQAAVPVPREQIELMRLVEAAYEAAESHQKIELA